MITVMGPFTSNQELHVPMLWILLEISQEWEQTYCEANLQEHVT